MAKRVRIGDVVPVLTSEGVAYAQFTHKHDEYGYLISVFEGFYNKIPKDFSAIVNGRPQFHAFFPLQSAVNQGLLSVVANVPVSQENSKFPVFRSSSIGKEGKRGPWWLWDGKNNVRLERDLTEEEKKFSTDGIISAPLLVERIQKGYRPEIDDI